MGTFIADGTAVLPLVKSDARPATVPPAATEWSAADANAVRTALLDLRTEWLTAGFYGGTSGVAVSIVASHATPDCDACSHAIVAVPAAGTLTDIDNPTGTPVLGQELVVTVENRSGGNLTITFGTAYKMGTWAVLATGYARCITFRYNGTNWLEITRTNTLSDIAL